MEPTVAAPTALQREARALMWLPGVVWLMVTPLVFLFAHAQTWTLYGTEPSPEQLHQRTTMLIWAAVCSAGAPLAGLGLAGAARSRPGRRFYALALALGCLPGLGWAATAVYEAPPPAPTQIICQEHSGGDTRCPGG